MAGRAVDWARGLLATALLVGGITAHAGDEPAWRATVREFAGKHFRQPAWGYSHSVRNYQLARDLAQADGVRLDDDVLFAAAFLHDIAAFPPWFDAKRDHADVGADLVEGVLKDTGFPMAKLDAVRGAIRTHMFDRQPEGPEAVYLHDADALDWLGAIGIARLTAIVDPQGGAPDGPAAVQMLEARLAAVPSRVFSPAGKARVAERESQLRGYLEALRQQTDGYRAL